MPLEERGRRNIDPPARSERDDDIRIVVDLENATVDPQQVSSGGDDSEHDETIVHALTGLDERLRRGIPTSHEFETISSQRDSPIATVVPCLKFLERAFPRRAISSHPPQSGRLGRFDLIRTLGQGGFGVVYLAHDPRLGRLVALKMPRLHTLGNRALHDRFLREARAAAQLDHPSIVPILESGEVGPVCYIASAYCEGADLEQWLKANAPVAPRLAARIVEVLADATHYSHTHGILHRDLKPSNVLLGSKTGSAECAADELPFVPRLTDFGLARFTEEAVGETGSAVVGTPLYMAPEQAVGQSDQVGAATDVYALGAILYELLTGRPPFQGTGFIEVLDQIRLTDPVPPARLVKSIPRDLETICLKCLAKAPTRRYVTAGALHDDLRAFREGRTITARPVGTLETAVKWARRRPLAATLALVIVAAVTTVVALQWKHSQTLTANLNTTEALRVEALAREAELRLQFNAAEINAVEYDLRDNIYGSIERANRRIKSVIKGISDGSTEPAGLEPEWNFVVRQIETPPPEGIFSGHDAAVFAVAVAPDGRLVASGDANGTIRIWQLDTQREIARIAAHEGEVRALAFSPRGDRLASGGQIHQLKLWSTTDWRLSESANAHDGTITCLAWRPDGGQIASGGRDGKICLSTAPNLTLEQKLDVGAVVNRVRYAADGSALYSSDKGNSVSMWKLSTSLVRRDQLLSTERNPLAFDISQGDRFGITESATFFEFDGRNRRAAPNFQYRAAVISKMGNWAATGGGEGCIDLWRWGDSPLESVSQQRWYGHSPKGIGDFAETPDGSRLLTTGLDGLVKVWRVDNFVHPTRQWLYGHSATVNGLDFSEDDRLIASAGDDGRVCVYETGKGRLIDSLKVGSGVKLRAPRFATDGCTLFVLADPPVGGVLIWRPGTSTPHRIVEMPGIRSSSMCPDGNQIALSLAPQKGIELWSTLSEKTVRNLVDPPLEAEGLQFSPDGLRLAAKLLGAETEFVTLIDIKNGARRELLGTYGHLNGLAFDHAGERLAVVTDGHLLQLFDVKTGTAIDAFQVSATESDISGLCFSPDDEVVAIGSRGIGERGGNVQVFHLGARRSALTFELHKGIINSVKFSRDGHILACTTEPTAQVDSGQIVLWRFDPPRAP